MSKRILFVLYFLCAILLKVNLVTALPIQYEISKNVSDTTLTGQMELVYKELIIRIEKVFNRYSYIYVENQWLTIDGRISSVTIDEWPEMFIPAEMADTVRANFKRKHIGRAAVYADALPIDSQSVAEPYGPENKRVFIIRIEDHTGECRLISLPYEYSDDGIIYRSKKIEPCKPIIYN